MVPVIVAAVVLAGCGAGSPERPEDCAGRLGRGRQEACYLEILPELLRHDPEGGVALAEEVVTDPQARDFLYFQQVLEGSPHPRAWCARIREPALVTRCGQLAARPHLFREGSRPGGAPPGEGTPPADAELPVPGAPAHATEGTLPGSGPARP